MLLSAWFLCSGRPRSASHRVTIECLHVCDRSLLDLPLADFIETELYNHVQDRADRLAAAKQHAAAGSMPTRQTGKEIADAEIFPAATTSAVIHQVFQGYWLLESFAAGSSQGGHGRSNGAGSTPALLHLAPAMNTKSKMALYNEMERMEKKRERIENKLQQLQLTNSGEEQNSASSAATSSSSLPPSSSSSLSCSRTVSVIVPSSVIDLLSESSDGGVGWQFNLELTRYEKDSRSLTMRQLTDAQQADGVEARLEPYFHITKAGHVNCA
jgi:hypothetical protein